MKRSYIIVLFFFLVIPFFSFAGTYDFLIKTGHFDSVETLAYSENDSYLFSGGADGTLRIWSTTNKEIIRNLQITDNSVISIALHPSKPFVAIIESNTISTYYLSIWNWDTGNRLHRRELKDNPLHLSYSPEGKYLLYTLPQWKSIKLLYGTSGRELSYFEEGFGIVSGATVSKSERTLMSYTASGTISYWDIRTEKEKASFSTVNNLKNIRISPNQLYLFGTKNTSLYMINLINGNIITKKELNSIDSIALHPNKENIACLTNKEDSKEILLYSYSKDGFNEIQFTAKDIPENTTGMVFANDKLYLSDKSGSISYFDTISLVSYNRIYAEDSLLSISDISFAGEQFSMISPNHLITLKSNFFHTLNRIGRETVTIETFMDKNPINRNARITYFSEDKLVVLTDFKFEGKLHIINPRTFENIFTYEEFQSPIQTIATSSDRFAVSTENGSCLIFDPETLRVKTDISVVGLKSMVLIPETNRIIAARSTVNTYQSPLISIDSITGETVPIETNTRYIEHLFYNPDSDYLYAFGLMERNGNRNSVISYYTDNSYEKASLLYEFEEQNTDLPIAFDRQNNRIYYSSGLDGIFRIKGSKVSSRYNLEPNTAQKVIDTDNLIRKIILLDDYIFSLNEDNSISVWNKITGSHILDFYLFKDLSWVAIPEGGGFYTSEHGLRHISVLQNGKPYNGSIEKFKIQ